MTWETTEARAESRYRDEAWRNHCMFCPQCGRAARSRKLAGLCVEGASAYAARAEARRELARNRQLDTQPMPGQEPLF
jgi:hypothetical protein